MCIRDSQIAYQEDREEDACSCTHGVVCDHSSCKEYCLSLIHILEGYQIKGTAEYVTEGAVVDTFKAMVEEMFHGAETAKGALIITPSKVCLLYTSKG